MRGSNYERAEEYLEDIDSEIEFEYGEPYSKLSESDKTDAIIEHFFDGVRRYKGAAEDLRDGIRYTSESEEAEVSVDRIRFDYGERRVIRGADGRFRKWV